MPLERNNVGEVSGPDVFKVMGLTVIFLACVVKKL
jgi:hypothetical protein